MLTVSRSCVLDADKRKLSFIILNSPTFNSEKRHRMKLSTP